MMGLRWEHRQRTTPCLCYANGCGGRGGEVGGGWVGEGVGCVCRWTSGPGRLDFSRSTFNGPTTVCTGLA